MPGTDLLEAAMRVCENKRIIWAKAKQQRDSLVADAIRDKSSLPDHYWDAEYRARQLYLAAIRVVEAAAESDNSV